MPVTTMRAPARQTQRLVGVWIPVRGTDGRTRMEMRWVDNTRSARRNVA